MTHSANAHFNPYPDPDHNPDPNPNAIHSNTNAVHPPKAFVENLEEDGGNSDIIGYMHCILL